MEFQVLVSTMKQKDYKLLKQMNLKSNAVVINQDKIDSVDYFDVGENSFKWVNSSEIGLSKSRNMAIENAEAKICLISDDDLIYLNEFDQTILNEFEKNKSADVIVFQVEGIDKKFKNYYKSARNLNWLTIMKVSSVEIAFKLSSIKENAIMFDEDFGAGAKYSSGEENIFLKECLDKGLKISYVPKKIANLYVGQSSWFQGFNMHYFISKGALFATFSKNWSFLLILQFLIRKYSIYSKDITLNKALKAMILGRKEYLSNQKQRDGLLKK